MTEKIFKVSSFGAVGDGLANDGYAISKAVKAALSDSSDIKRVEFDREKTYRVTAIPEENKRQCLFSINGGENIEICGNGAKLLFKGTVKLLSAEKVKNLKFGGFIIDYSPKPFVLARLTEKDSDKAVMCFETEEDIGLKGEEYLPPQPFFMFPNRRDMRYHYFIEKVERQKLDHYRMTIRNNTIGRIKDANIGDEFLLPYIGGSHLVGGACTLYECDGFEIHDLRFYSHPEFGFDIRMNTGRMLFNNIVLKSPDYAKEQLISWRDCFHVKDNIDPIIWDNCYIGPIGDDAFNLSCVHLDVTEVGEDKKTIHCLPAEKGKTRELSAGDEFIAYDLETGSFVGEGHVEAVIDSTEDVHFVSDVPLEKLSPGMQISFYKYANPGFIVRNSYIEGTVRVRSSGIFENCLFNVFWVRVENEFFVEGPVPKNVTFKNCRFTTLYDKDEVIFHVGTLGKNGLTNCEYKCKNIILENCTFEKGNYFAEEGNELIVKESKLL